MKTFDNPKNLKEYLKTVAVEGEKVCLDERATFTHPKRKRYFRNKKQEDGED